MAQVSDLLGKTLSRISQGDDFIVFETTELKEYKMYHEQDCCECVRIEDIIGDLNDLIGEEILMAEESTNADNTEYGSETWTFYRFATIKGYVTIRWYGESNGYYSESVDFIDMRA